MIKEGDIVPILFKETFVRETKTIYENEFIQQGKVQRVRDNICLVKLVKSRDIIWVKRFGDDLFLHTIKGYI